MIAQDWKKNVQLVVNFLTRGLKKKFATWLDVHFHPSTIEKYSTQIQLLRVGIQDTCKMYNVIANVNK